jgi:hypothetical protein
MSRGRPIRLPNGTRWGDLCGRDPVSLLRLRARWTETLEISDILRARWTTTQIDIFVVPSVCAERIQIVRYVARENNAQKHDEFRLAYSLSL